jgi:hypothetical protein
VLVLDGLLVLAPSTLDGEQVSNRGHGYFPHNFWSSHEYLVHYQSEGFCAQ